MFQRARILVLLIVISSMLVSCGKPPASIVRRPKPVDYSFLNPHPTVPSYDPANPDPFQVDLRSANLTGLDLSQSLEVLLYASFDSKTQWPSADKLPAGFDPAAIMETGKDPGLGIRALHQQGITGKGIGVAIIDQTLLVDHVEYGDRVRVYEEGEDVTGGWLQTSMHGPAVASIAVGESVGVAPEANLYFVASGGCNRDVNTQSLDYSCLAKDVLRIVEINKGLPPDQKIRVLSISIGWMPDSTGHDEIMAAVGTARTAGIFVITVSLYETHGWNILGLGRSALADPNRFESFLPGVYWAQGFYNDNHPLNQVLLAPMDARTTASPTGLEDYAFYGIGGMSWTIPYLAGMYALAAQVKPDITPEEFWAAALNTGQTIQVQQNGTSYSLGIILDPQALIAEFQK